MITINLPFDIGDTLYTIYAPVGWYFRKKNRPYAVKVVFIGINNKNNWFNVQYIGDKGCMLQFQFSDLGDKIFLTAEEAITALQHEHNK